MNYEKYKKNTKRYLCSTQTISQGENIKKQLDQFLTNVSEVKLNLTWGDINLSGIKSKKRGKSNVVFFLRLASLKLDRALTGSNSLRTRKDHG